MNFDPYSNRIFIWGMPGSGKSTFGRHLALGLQCAFTDLDIYIENACGKTIPQLFREKGEGEFRNLEKQYLREVVQQKTGVIATGGGTPCFFDQEQFMKQHGLTIFLDTPMDIIERRVSGRTGRPLLDKSDDQLSELR
ncbi:MAG: shikimate kinase, partial [Cyclobacteriaceae bacterium]